MLILNRIHWVLLHECSKIDCKLKKSSTLSYQLADDKKSISSSFRRDIKNGFIMGRVGSEIMLELYCFNDKSCWDWELSLKFWILVKFRRFSLIFCRTSCIFGRNRHSSWNFSQTFKIFVKLRLPSCNFAYLRKFSSIFVQLRLSSCNFVNFHQTS